MPTLNSSAIGIVESTSLNNSILLSRSQLASSLYISIFAYEFSEINIEVIVHHYDFSYKNIPLNHDTVQTYTLPSSEPTISFTIDSNDDKYISVFLNELAGIVEMKLHDNNNQDINCSDSR